MCNKHWSEVCYCVTFAQSLTSTIVIICCVDPDIVYFEAADLSPEGTDDDIEEGPMHRIQQSILDMEDMIDRRKIESGIIGVLLRSLIVF